MSNHNPRRPYRSVDHRIPLQRGPGHPLGFVRTVRGKFDQLKREVEGLRDRVKFRYGQDVGQPHAYKAERVFRPGEDLFVIPTVTRTAPFSIPPGPPIDFVNAVNVVVPDAQILSVPIVMEGPGVFVARYFTVTFYQRVWGGDDPATGDSERLRSGKEYRFALPIGKSYLQSVCANTRKWSLTPNLRSHLPYDVIAPPADGNPVPMRGVCFFWNLIDRDSGRRMADDTISEQALLPGGYNGQVDGGLFEFPVPWLFERAGMLEFQFQLTTPVLQPAILPPGSPLLAPTPFQWDDTENNGNTRNMEVTVRAELHGTKFVNERDAVLRERI